jgi:1-deoxy-D-xylulose-5-phosphate synthase
MSIADQVRSADPTTTVDVLGLPTKFMPHDPKPAHIHARFHLDAASLVELIRGG